jgi:hypothetical protein
MSDKQVVVNNGCGGSASAMLGILFVILKVLEIITWSWWLVLLPFYFGFVIIFGGMIMAAVILFFTWLLVNIFDR